MTHKPKTRYIYNAGVLDKRDNWLWQGYVVARNMSQGRKIIKHEVKQKGTIMIRAVSRRVTTKTLGVYV